MNTVKGLFKSEEKKAFRLALLSLSLIPPATTKGRGHCYWDLYLKFYWMFMYQASLLQLIIRGKEKKKPMRSYLYYQLAAAALSNLLFIKKKGLSVKSRNEEHVHPRSLPRIPHFSLVKSWNSPYPAHTHTHAERQECRRGSFLFDDLNKQKSETLPQSARWISLCHPPPARAENLCQHHPLQHSILTKREGGRKPMGTLSC